MNDLGVSLHSHNNEDTFLDAAKKLNAAAGEMHFNPKYLDPNFEPSRTDSPILGIERTIPQFTDPKLANYLIAPGADFVGTLEEYGQMAKLRLKAHLKKHWDVAHPMLFLHSNGYDSRILSSILAELRDEGFDLGTIHFRCHEPEGASFKVIMQRQGWKPDQYSVFKDPEKDIFDIGRWGNCGTSPWLPVTTAANFWRDLVPYGDEKHWNLMGGTGGGEACEYGTIGKAPFVPWQYCGNKPVQLWFSYFADGTDWAADVEALFHKVLFPYFGDAHIRTVAALPPRFLKYEENGCDMVRASILRTFKDSLLDLPRAPRTYSWSISSARWMEMQAYYEGSAFLREVPGAPGAEQLFATMKKNFFTKDNWAERMWRLAALWEKVRAA